MSYNLTQDAALKVFWRKNSLRRFLRQHHISENELATWHSEDESKRDYLTRLSALKTIWVIKSLAGC